MTNVAYFAGGCFWCVEHDLGALSGVISAVSGYMGGTMLDPTYEDHGDHREAVFVTYDPAKTSFKKLVQFFIDHIDPTDTGGQFHDRGGSYRTAIFFNSAEEKEIIDGALMELDASHVYDRPHAVEVLPATRFYEAEEYHQRYAEKNPVQYSAYRQGSGREDFVNRTCQIREEKHIIWKEE